MWCIFKRGWAGLCTGLAGCCRNRLLHQRDNITNIETAARKLRQGAQVREGLIVEEVEEFDYDRSLGTNAEELALSVQFTVGVVVRRARVLRTRARFDEWAATIRVDTDPELVDREQLLTWLDIGGRRIGVGNWRPEKSGQFGRFEVKNIQTIS